MRPVGLTPIPALRLLNATAREADIAALEEAQELLDLANQDAANEVLHTAWSGTDCRRSRMVASGKGGTPAVMMRGGSLAACASIVENTRKICTAASCR